MFRPKEFIDNKRVILADTLRELAPYYKKISIATGYWDIEGTLEVIYELKDYDEIRLLIGQDPFAHKLQKLYNLNNAESIFPDFDIKNDLNKNIDVDQYAKLQEVAQILMELMKNKKLKVRVFREPRLHAKSYIFGEFGNGNSIGIIGSSNFTKAGLTSNTELNFLTYDSQKVEFQPNSLAQENGHLAWYEELWNSEEAEDWNGEFTKILSESSLGYDSYGAYDVYIRTLMEILSEELIEPTPLTEKINNYLLPFQLENSYALRRKLIKNEVAMLSDSVGLGKTVTAASIIHQYSIEGKQPIVLILPPSLKQQWISELSNNPWNLEINKDYMIVSQSNINEIEKLTEETIENKTSNFISLFVIDEAHNFKNKKGKIYEALAELLQHNKEAHVLLLTATPINNSLLDFANQIELAGKNKIDSVKVALPARDAEQVDQVSFFDALKIIQKESKTTIKRGEKFDWQFYKDTLVNGLKNYVIRSTRQGVIRRNDLKSIIDKETPFPKSKVSQITYKITKAQLLEINEIVSKYEPESLNINPMEINVDILSNLTQVNSHPFDVVNDIHGLQLNGRNEVIQEKYRLSELIANKNIIDINKSKSAITSLYRLISLLGLIPYRPEIYQYKIYGKSLFKLKDNNWPKELGNAIQNQLTVHNIIHVQWLKRLESSVKAFEVSLRNYSNRLNLFEKWLNKGYIVSATDVENLDREYGDDIESAFFDYDSYIEEIDQDMENNQNSNIRKKGIERKDADNSIYNIQKIKIDIKRDKEILNIIFEICNVLIGENKDSKLEELANHIISLTNSQKYGKKILVFSYYAHTIEYLQENLTKVINGRINDFDEKASFVTGKSKEIKKMTKLFSPKSQKYDIKEDEIEIDYLFATDVLSEGQNLQDAGILINYDLHWNPVRMIQRNGRINRLGSIYDEILVLNSRPIDELETYLKLVNRLEFKINAIVNTIGTDTSVLGEAINPLEFNDISDSDYEIFSLDSERASEAWGNLENENDILDWVDDYSLELRQFLANNSDEEIQRIKNIPVGKWNNLPIHNKQKFRYADEVIGLYELDSKTSDEGSRNKNYSFVKIYSSGEDLGPYSNLVSEYITEEEALSKIKTTPDDNLKTKLSGGYNRTEYIALGKETINIYNDELKVTYKIKPQGERAILGLLDYFPDKPIVNLLTENLYGKEKSQFESIVKYINEELDQKAEVSKKSVMEFNKLLKKLEEREKFKEIITDEIRGVFFYVYP